MNCLVTGGAGFIGSHLVDLLLDKGHKVISIDNLVSGQEKNFVKHLKNKKFKFIQSDIRDLKNIENHFIDIDWVFHLAALADIVPSIENPDDYYSTNVTGTFNVLKMSRKNNVKRFVYAASSSCYGIPNEYPTSENADISPRYPYALTKYLGEELVMHWSEVYKLSSTSLRLFNVYGPRSRTTGTYGAVFGVFLAQKIKNKPFTVVGDGNQTRDFTFVTDVAKAFYEAAKSKDVSSEVINVGSGDHYSINTLINLLGGEVVYIPKRPGEPDCTFADTTKIKKLLNWSPEVSFEEGVEKILQKINDWEDAPLWDQHSIQKATRAWFDYLKKE